MGDEKLPNPYDTGLADWERELFFPVRENDVAFIKARDVNPDLQGPLSTGSISFMIKRESEPRADVVKKITELLGKMSLEDVQRAYSYMELLNQHSKEDGNG